MTSPDLENDDDDDVPQLETSADPVGHIQVSLSTIKKMYEFLKLKYSNNDKAIEINKIKEFNNIINFGLISVHHQLYSKDSDLLHKGKKPRRDVWIKLGRIASGFLNCDSYPSITSDDFESILENALGNADERVKKDYNTTILSYSNYTSFYNTRNSVLGIGTVDVAYFISLIPKQYLATSSTSSFSE